MAEQMSSKNFLVIEHLLVAKPHLSHQLCLCSLVRAKSEGNIFRLNPEGSIMQILKCVQVPEYLCLWRDAAFVLDRHLLIMYFLFFFL